MRRSSPLQRLMKIALTVLVLGLAAIWIYPFILTVFTSLKTPDDVLNDPFNFPPHRTRDAYSTVWTELNFGQLLKNSLLYAILGSLFALAFAAFPSYAFSRFRILGGRTLFTILLTTLMLPQQTVIIPLYTELDHFRLLNTQAGLILIHTVYGIPFTMLLLTGFMANMPRELESAARVDGCGDVGVLLRVMLPLSVPALAVALTLNFIGIWKEFIFALSFLNSDSVLPITTGILKFTVSQYFSTFNQPAAAVIASLLPILVLFVFAHRWIMQGIYVGAVKG
jgi:raffinose/stachyose/melibiose transport system permease protein